MKIVNKLWIICVFMFMQWHFCIGQEFDSLIKTWTKKDYDNIIACGRGERGPLKRNYILDICVPWTNLFQSSQRGVHLKLHFFISNKISIGGSVQSAYTLTEKNFNLIIENPILNQNYIGVIIEYNLIRFKRIEMSYLFENGYVRTELGNYKNSSLDAVYAMNKQYYISPTMNLSFILFPLKDKYGVQLQIFSQLGYKRLIGASQFGSSRELSNAFAQIGLRLLFRNAESNPYLIDKIKKYRKAKNDS